MPVRKALLKQIVPAVISQMIVLIYSLADTYFVGLLNDPRQTAAVTVVSSAFLMLTAVSNLFAVGGASLAARTLGRREDEKAKDICALSFWGALLAPILYLCGATADTYPFAFGYAKWVVLFGGAGTVLNVLLANLIRAEGNALVAALGVSLGGICNIVLDPIFVLPRFLNLGAAGAGAATAISNTAAALFFILFAAAKRRSTIVSLSPARLKRAHKHIKDILAVGFPSAVQYALTVVSIAAISKFVSGYATEAVAALGIVKKLDQLPLYFSIGVANGLLPFLAYNYASGNQKRRHDAFLFGCGISLGFSLLCVGVYECFAPYLTGLFISDPLTVSYSAAFLRIMVVAMPMMSLCYPMIIQFQAVGNVKASLICSILRKGVLDIPLLFLLDRLVPLYGCMAVQPVVDTISLIAAIYFYRRTRKAQSPHIPA